MAVLLAALLVFGSSSLVYIFAAGSEVTVYQVILPRGDDPNQTGWGHEPPEFLNGWHNRASSTSFLAKAKDSYNGDAVYCIEPGVTIKTGDIVGSANARETSTPARSSSQIFFISIPPRFHKTIHRYTINFVLMQ